MRKKRNTIWIAAMLTAAVLTGFSGCTEGEIPSLSSSDTAETTTASPEESAAESSTEETAETSAAETEAATETNGNCGNHFGGNDNSSRSWCRHPGICGCGKDTVRGIELHRPDRQRQPAER